MINNGTTLYQGQSLAENNYIASDNGQYYAIMQTDGNFVLYKGQPQGLNTPIWDSHTPNKSTGPYDARMQEDGNFVVYAKSGTEPIWASHSQFKSNKPYQLVMQSDGNLVVYGESGKVPIWASGTQGR